MSIYFGLSQSLDTIYPPVADVYAGASSGTTTTGDNITWHKDYPEYYRCDWDSGSPVNGVPQRFEIVTVIKILEQLGLSEEEVQAIMALPPEKQEALACVIRNATRVFKEEAQAAIEHKRLGNPIQEIV